MANDTITLTKEDVEAMITDQLREKRGLTAVAFHAHVLSQTVVVEVTPVDPNGKG